MCKKIGAPTIASEPAYLSSLKYQNFSERTALDQR
jgi:hypothetical protein